MFIRTQRIKNRSTGKLYEYRQIVESVWQDDRSRHRVVASLGTAPTVEKKLEELRAELAPLEAAHDEHLEKATTAQDTIKRRWWPIVESYHGGIPSMEQVVRAAGTWFGSGSSREQREYRYQFGGYEVRESPYLGKYEIFQGYAEFRGEHRTMVQESRFAEGLEPQIKKLRVRIAALEEAKAALEEPSN